MKTYLLKAISKIRYLALLMFLTIVSAHVWGAVTALTIPKSWGSSDGKSAYTEALGCTLSGLGSDYSSAPKLKFDNQGDYMIIQIASAPAYVTFNIKGNSYTAGKFTVQESPNGSTYTDAASYTTEITSSSTSKTISLKSTTRYIKFIYTTKNAGNVGLGGITIKARTTVTLNKNGGSADGSAVILFNATAYESFSAATRAGYTCTGYWTATSGGTKVLKSDGTYATTSVSGWLSSSKWSKDAATAMLYAQWEAAAATPSLTATPTNLSWGTVLQGSSQSTKTISITGTNLTAGTLTISATGGYSVTPTSKSVSGTLSATTLTVTPPSTATTGAKNGKVTISGGGLASNVEVNLSMTVNAASTVTWMNNGSEYTTTLVANGSKPTFPSTPISCDGTSNTFIGWATAAWTGKIANLTGKTVYTSAASMPTVSGAVTYYAVFAKATAASSTKTYSFSITSSNFNSTSYAANNNEKTTTATATDASGATIDVKWTSYQVMLQSSAMQWQKSAGYIYNSTDLGTVNSVVVTSSAGTYTTYYGTTSQPSSGAQGSGKGYFKTSVGSATGTATKLTVNFTKTTSGGTTYSDYLTTCCNSLGAINGSISLTNESNC